MTEKLVLTLKTTSSPHLYLDTLKEIIKKDDYLLPAMRGYLNFMKKTKRSYIPLPLQTEVLICPEFKTNLTRGLSPQLGDFNIVIWTNSDVEKYNLNPKKFIEDIKLLYSQLGYEIEEMTPPTDEIIQQTINDFNTKKEKYLKMTEATKSTTKTNEKK